VNIFVELLISKAKNVESMVGEAFAATQMIFESFRLQMLWPVQLDNEFERETSKVSDEIVDCDLSTELMTGKFFSAKKMP